MVVALAELAMQTAPWFAFFGTMQILARFTAPSKLDGPTRAYWASSIVSTIHGVYVAPLAWRAMSSGGYWSSDDVTLATDDAVHCCAIYLGYLIADFVPLLVYVNAWKGSTPYLWHHGLSLISWCMMATRGHLLAVAVGLLLLEATAPFTNGRWFLSTIGISSGLLYTINGLCMAISFFVLRVCFMGWLFVRYVVVLRAGFFALPPTTWLTVLACYAFGYPLQLFWFRKIAIGIVKVLSGGKKKSK
jgi:hypothetical protein